jgi:hypothetical protein
MEGIWRFVLHPELNLPITQEDPGTRRDLSDNLGKIYSHAGFAAHAGRGAQGEVLPFLKRHLSLREGADAQLGPGQVQQDGHRPSQTGRGLPDAVNPGLVFFPGAVGEIEAGHVHPGFDQSEQDLTGAGRTQGTDDFCASFVF